MKITDVINCSFSKWYPKFEKCTISSEVLEISDDVLSYLLDTGTLVLPQSCQASAGPCDQTVSSDDEDWGTDDTAAAQAPVLDEFSSKIRAAIRRLGGAVFPKLNWTAPKDAAWMSYTQSLKCSTAEDVYLLLKSSNDITRDLATPYQDCSDATSALITTCAPVLVLRNWQEMNPSTEFRGFVRDRQFVGFCPRDVSQHYPCLGAERSSIVGDVTSFWRENIDNRFPLSSYVFDVVRLGKGRVLLVDFAPLHQSRSNCLLYDWEELCLPRLPPPVRIREHMENLELEICDNLQSISIHNSEDSNRISEELQQEEEEAPQQEETPEFRYINQETGVQPNHNRQFGVPVDIMDLCSGQDPWKLKDFLQMKSRPEGEVDSCTSDEDPE